MTTIFYTIFGLTLIVIQTAFLPYLHSTRYYFDLLIPMVVFSGLFRPFREGLLSSLTFGIVMDGLSGGPFGLFTTVFFWVFAGAKWIINFLHAGNWFILPFLLSGAVLFENLICIVGWMFSVSSTGHLTEADIQRVIHQMIWAAFTGPFIVWGIDLGYRKWHRLGNQVKGWNGH